MPLPHKGPTPGRSARQFLIAAALFLATALPTGAATTAVRPDGASIREAELRTVLTVVEQRTDDKKVLEKTEKKLSELEDRDLRLAALLCERIIRDSGGAGANIAFSIVAAMIVLR